MSSSEGGGFVPVDGRALRALELASAELASAEKGLRQASDALLELAGDMKIDAVRRLSERGASSAQLERYEGAFGACSDAMRARRRALEEACAKIHEAVRALGG